MPWVWTTRGVPEASASSAARGEQERAGGDSADLESGEEMACPEEMRRHSLHLAREGVLEAVAERHDPGVVAGGPLDLRQIERHPGGAAERMVRGVQCDDVQDLHQGSPRTRSALCRLVIRTPQVG
jgi:hypothetical protein